MKKIKLCILLTCCFLILGMTSNNKTYAQENTIPLNGEWVSDSVTDDICYYTFTIPSSGTVTYTFQSYSYGGKISLTDKTLSTIYSETYCDGNSDASETSTKDIILEQGTYVFKICSDWDDNWSGDFRLKVNFASDTVIPLDGTWVNGDLRDNVCLYKFTIPSSGTITYTFQAYSADNGISLKDDTLSTTYSEIHCTDGNSDIPETKTESVTLEQGTYTFRVWTLWTEERGPYRLKVDFSPANNNEIEPNNNFETAMELSDNKEIIGLISENDSIDFYKFTLKQTHKLNIIYHFKNEFRLSILDDDYVTIKVIDDGKKNINQKLEEYLEAGTYYIKIENFFADSVYGNTGTYTLKLQPQIRVSSIELKGTTLTLKKGKSYDLLANVQPNNATNKELKWTSSNSTVASVNASGKVTANKVGASIITATSQDGSDISTSCIIIVKPQKTKITKLNYNSSDARKINVQLRKQDGVSGYQIAYSTDKNFKNKSTYISKSTSTVTRKLAKNKKYYFKARAYYTYKNTRYYGAWSNVKEVKTKKN